MLALMPPAPESRPLTVGPETDRSPAPRRPTRQQILAAAGGTVPDVIAPHLRVLFCGINPGLYSAAVSHHFARPGNRFWLTLHLSGFTPRLLTCFEERELPALGLGITNLVARGTASAAELSAEELRQGAAALAQKTALFRPRYVAFVGMQAYRVAFERPKAAVGLQPEMLAESKIWLLPNPSGLQAHYQLPDLARLYADLRQAAGEAG